MIDRQCIGKNYLYTQPDIAYQNNFRGKCFDGNYMKTMRTVC